MIRSQAKRPSSGEQRTARSRDGSCCRRWTAEGSGQLEVSEVEVGAAVLVLLHLPRPVRRDPPAVAVVPVVAADPHAVGQAVLDLPVVALLGLRPNGDRAGP